MNQQPAFRLSSDMIDPNLPDQVQQALIEARQQRIERELESNASIGRHYRALVGRGASPAQIAQGLRDVINTLATSGHFSARDHRVLAAHARAEADRAREAENNHGHAEPPNDKIRDHDHFNSVPFGTAVFTHTSISDEQAIPPSSEPTHVVNTQARHHVRAAFVAEAYEDLQSTQEVSEEVPDE